MSRDPERQTYQRLHKKGLLAPSKEHGAAVATMVHAIWDRTPYQSDHFERRRAICEFFQDEPFYGAMYRWHPEFILQLVDTLLDVTKNGREIIHGSRPNAGRNGSADVGGPNGNRGPYSGRPPADLLGDRNQPTRLPSAPIRTASVDPWGQQTTASLMTRTRTSAVPPSGLAKFIQEERRTSARATFFDTAKVFGVPILEATAEQTILCGNQYIDEGNAELKKSKTAIKQSRFAFYNGLVMVDLGAEATDKQQIMDDVWPDKSDPRIDLICAQAKDKVSAYVGR